MPTKEKRTEYDWDHDSVIRRIDVRQEPNGRTLAYIYANEAPEASAARQNILAVLDKAGLGTVSDYHDGKFGLRVSGLKNGGELISLLTKNDLAKPPVATKTSIPEPTAAKPKSFFESIRTNSLRAAGIFYSIGNIVYFTSGILRRRESGKPNSGQIGSALVWGGGDILIATIGGHDDSRQFTSLLTKLKEHYAKEGIAITDNSSIDVETSTKDKTLGSKIYDVLHTYVNQIKCVSEVAAAFFYFRAGKEQGNVWKQRTAVTFGTGFAASLLIPEKKIDGEKYAAAGPLGKLWMKIQSNPLSVGGISGYSNTVLTTVGAYKEGQMYRAGSRLPMAAGGEPPSKYYKLDYAAPAVMLFGNTFYAISKKHTGGDIKTEGAVSDIYTLAAQVLNSQPEATRQAALDSTARFLGERPEIKDTHSQIVVRLKERMALQKQNPWSASAEPAPAAPALAAATSAPEMTAAVPSPAPSAEPQPQVRTEGLQHTKNAAGVIHAHAPAQGASL